MIGGEFVITWGGFMAIAVVCALLGLLVGWMGGKAEGRDKERERAGRRVAHLEEALRDLLNALTPRILEAPDFLDAAHTLQNAKRAARAALKDDPT